MILKAFKEKSNQKFVEKTLANRNVAVTSKNVTSVAVLLNASEYVNYDEVNSFLNEINIAEKDRQFFVYADNQKQEFASWENSYTKKDFGWKGKLKNQDLLKFTETKFDVLICYFLEDKAELTQIAATSQANFKVGISNKNQRLYDLMIDVAIKDFKLFKEELKKYLSILNKL